MHSSFFPFFRRSATAFVAADAGWMCTQGGEGRRFGRVFEPSVETHGLSIDVVDLTDIVGPQLRREILARGQSRGYPWYSASLMGRKQRWTGSVLKIE